MSDAHPESPALQTGFLGVHIGNTRTRTALLRGRQVLEGQSFENADEAGLIRDLLERFRRESADAIVIADVNRQLADRVEQGLLQDGLERDEVYRVGRDLQVPIVNALDDDSTVGKDRLLAALGAYCRAGQACVVVDAGTAVTVDLVDGRGVFQGGAIAPGLNMMLRALHEQTAALPELKFSKPDAARGEVGKDTAHAMILGVRAAIQGMVRLLAERYAELQGGYPQIVATGGDAIALFDGDEVIETIVPDLALIGLAETCVRMLTDEADVAAAVDADDEEERED